MVALGPIGADTVADYARTGAEFVAVGAGVWDHPDGPAAGARAIAEAIASGNRQGPARQTRRRRSPALVGWFHCAGRRDRLYFPSPGHHRRTDRCSRPSPLPSPSPAIRRMHPALALLVVALGAAACSPTVRIVPPEEPIRIDLAVTIQQDPCGSPSASADRSSSRSGQEPFPWRHPMARTPPFLVLATAPLPGHRPPRVRSAEEPVGP